MTTSRDTILIYTCTYPRNFCQRRIWIKSRWLIGNIRTSFNEKWECTYLRVLLANFLHVGIHESIVIPRLVEDIFQLWLMEFVCPCHCHYQRQHTQAVIQLQQDAPFELNNEEPIKYNFKYMTPISSLTVILWLSNVFVSSWSFNLFNSMTAPIFAAKWIIKKKFRICPEEIMTFYPKTIGQ